MTLQFHQTPEGSAYDDPTLYLYTSLTAGSSHIITATSRLELILKYNGIPFKAIDIATDQKGRSLWGRRNQGKRLPGLVKRGAVLGNIQDVEKWNDCGVLEEEINQKHGVPSLPPAQQVNVGPSPMPKSFPTRSPETQQAPSSRKIQIQEPEPPKNQDGYRLAEALRKAGKEAAQASLKSMQSPVKRNDMAISSFSRTPLSKEDAITQRDKQEQPGKDDSEKRGPV